MSGEYRAGIIGLGRMGARIDDEMVGHPVFLVPYSHAAAFANEPRTRLVAGAAPSGESRDQFQQRYGDVRTYADYSEMLEEESLDIVGVATHAPLHADATVAAAAAGATVEIMMEGLEVRIADAQEPLQLLGVRATNLLHVLQEAHRVAVPGREIEIGAHGAVIEAVEAAHEVVPDRPTRTELAQDLRLGTVEHGHLI